MKTAYFAKETLFYTFTGHMTCTESHDMYEVCADGSVDWDISKYYQILFEDLGDI